MECAVPACWRAGLGRTIDPTMSWECVEASVMGAEVISEDEREDVNCEM